MSQKYSKIQTLSRLKERVTEDVDALSLEAANDLVNLYEKHFDAVKDSYYIRKLRDFYPDYIKYLNVLNV